MVLLVPVVVVGVGIWLTGYRSLQAFSQPSPVPLVEIDTGDIPIYVVESGTLESSNNATIRCQVEALLGTISDTGGGRSGRFGGTTSRGGGMGGGGGGLAAAAGLGAAAKTSAGLRGASAAAAKSGGGAASVGGGGAMGMGGGSTGVRAPTIRSFTYRVTPHVPLRPRSSGSSSSSSRSRSSGMSMMGGGGGGFGSQEQEQRGSTRIISILPEGTPVKAGDVVCRLDSVDFEDELLAQQIRHDQAKAWVQQARALLEVNEISLREYKEGLLPQDRASIQGYIDQCELELQRARDTLEWSKDAFEKGFRTASQVRSDELALERAQIQRREADTMRQRLEKFAAPRLINNLEAKSAAIRSDLLAQEESLNIEANRLKRLKENIENCTLRAPRDGVVVYANQSSGWGRTETQIMEGATVRERQPIINLPDPNNMSVRVKINESKISYIYPGQRARILIDAFHEQPVSGTVAEVTVIPAPANGPISDVKIYNAVVKIDIGGFEGLRPGMTAEVAFHVEDRENVTRIPTGAIRWVADEPYVAKSNRDNQLGWVKVELGKIGPHFAEVHSGLEPGDRVAQDPRALPIPGEAPADPKNVPNIAPGDLSQAAS
jgi:multidrug efflux pump subunit AcrA (membrane-fusion protein)